MLLFFNQLAFTFIILQQSVGEPSTNLLFQYGLAGALIVLLIMLFKFFASNTNKESAAREDKIMTHNKLREESYRETVDSLKGLIRELDQNWKTTADRMDRNYQHSIGEFIKVIDKVMDQNSYTTEVLIQLQHKVDAALKKNDIEALRNEIVGIIRKIGLEYNLTPKHRD